MAKILSLTRRAAAELIGTLIFVFLAAGSVVMSAYLSLPTYVSLAFVALTTGVALSLAVSSTMNISGGHINPAVTIGVFAAGLIKLRDALVYITAQVTGAVIGASLLLVLFPFNIGSAVAWGTPSLSVSVNTLQGIAIESILTFILVFMVFGTAIDKKTPKIAGFGIGLAAAADAIVGGTLTGAAMNPARAIGPAIVSLSFANWFVYWIGPIIGGVVAALLYSKIFLSDRK